MRKKDLGLLLLIVVVGVVVAIINPRFLLPINLANTANLIGLFGILAIGQAFVIITGGIELSVGSLVALLGTLFIDFIAVRDMPWPMRSACSGYSPSARPSSSSPAVSNCLWDRW